MGDQATTGIVVEAPALVGDLPRITVAQCGHQTLMAIDGEFADIEIWSHQRCSDPPALSRKEFQGFTALRAWAGQFYPDGGPAGTDPRRAHSGAV